MDREVKEITSTGAWLDWRRSDITASRLPALFDLHPYLTRDQLADIMRGSVSSGAGAIPADSPAMRAGRILEPAVAAAISEEKPEWTLRKATTYHRLPDHRLGCTPDYFCATTNADDGLIQIKTVGPHQFEKWHGKVPTGYLIQTLCELLVTGRSWGCLAVMVRSPSYPVFYYDVPRHDAAERKILDAVAAWWLDFNEGNIPGAVASAAIAADLDDGSHKDLSSDNFLCASLPERSRLKWEISANEKRVAEIDAALKAALGPASSGWVPGYNISFKSQHRRETVIPARDIRVLRVRAAAEEEGADADTM
jgi:predicted phage-related endonuclease